MMKNVDISFDEEVVKDKFFYIKDARFDDYHLDKMELKYFAAVGEWGLLEGGFWNGEKFLTVDVLKEIICQIESLNKTGELKR